MSSKYQERKHRVLAHHEDVVLPSLSPGQLWETYIMPKAKGEELKFSIVLLTQNRGVFPDAQYQLIRTHFRIGACDPRTGFQVFDAELSLKELTPHRIIKEYWTPILFLQSWRPLVYTRPVGYWPHWDVQ